MSPLCNHLGSEKSIIYVHSFFLLIFAQTVVIMSATTAEQPTKQPNIFGLITPEQLADQLGVTVRTLQQWNLKRTGPPRVVIGQQIFYKQTSVQAWIDARESKHSR